MNKVMGGKWVAKDEMCAAWGRHGGDIGAAWGGMGRAKGGMKEEYGKLDHCNRSRPV